MFPDDLRRFVEGERWTFARTMPDWPHEYLVRGRVDEVLFIRTAQHIRDRGFDGLFYSRTIRYFAAGPFVYWTMGALLEETVIINRCLKEQTFEWRKANGCLPIGRGRSMPPHDIAAQGSPTER